MKFNPGCNCCGSPDCPDCCRYRAPFLGDWTTGDVDQAEFTVVLSDVGLISYPGGIETITPIGVDGTWVLTKAGISGMPESFASYQYGIQSGDICVALKFFCDGESGGFGDIRPHLVAQNVGGESVLGVEWNNFSSTTWTRVLSSDTTGTASVSQSHSEPMPDGCCCCTSLSVTAIEEVSDSMHYAVVEIYGNAYLLLKSGATYTREDRGDGVTIEMEIDPTPTTSTGQGILNCHGSEGYTQNTHAVTSLTYSDGTNTITFSGSGGQICRTSSDPLCDDSCCLPTILDSGANVMLIAESDIADLPLDFEMTEDDGGFNCTYSGSFSLPFSGGTEIDGYVIGGGWGILNVPVSPDCDTEAELPPMRFSGAVGSQGLWMSTSGSIGSGSPIVGLIGLLHQSGVGEFSLGGRCPIASYGEGTISW